MTPLFLGLSGTTITPEERALFRFADPAGYILFGRNCDNPDQVLALTDALRDMTGRDLPILIDQEGGRVARLRPPFWPEFPAAGRFDRLYDLAPITAIEAARINALVLALTLRDVGVTVDCLPLLDVRQPDGNAIIGDRSYGAEPMRVAALGKATLDGLRAGGVIGVIKHIPGHGRATVDSHVELPVVDADRSLLEVDFEPFKSLSAAPMAMTAHVVYSALDPHACATLSPLVIGNTIRSEIGFDGLLLSDDLGMKALGGSFAERTRLCLAAGCDIALHCSGDLKEMEEVVAGATPMTAKAGERLAVAMLWAMTPATMSIEELTAKRDALLANG